MAETTERKTPPYVSFTTFTNLLDRLKEAVPPQIDNTVLSNHSGATQSQLKVGLRFLSLINGNGTVNPKLEKLVKAYGTPDWKAVWGGVLSDAYSNVMANVDKDTGTLQQLQAAFTAAGCESAAVREKAIRFYLSGLDSAGFTYSRFFTMRGARTSERKKPGKGSVTRKPPQRKKPTSRRSNEQQRPPEPKTPEGFINHTFPLRPDVRLELMLPTDITHADVERMYKWLKSLPMEEEQ